MDNTTPPSSDSPTSPPVPPHRPVVPPQPIPVYLPPGGTGQYRPRGSVLGWVFRSFLGFVIVMSLLANFYLGIIVFGGMGTDEYRSGDEHEKIALIHLNGAIDMNTAIEMHSHFRRAEEDDDVQAVIMVVNSPGGQVAPSDMINRYIRDYREKTKKKVYVSIQQVGASGAYWIASAADKIYSQENGMVGSIGVIGTFFVVEQGLREKLGITPVIIKSTKSPYKDRGSPFHLPTEEEKADIRADIDEIHARFVEVVTQGRDLTKEQVWALADGDVYFGDQAKENKLIDETGYLDDVIDDLARVLKLDDPMVIHYYRPPTLREMIFAGTKAPDHPLDIQKHLEKWAMTPRIQAIWLGQ
jgi:protease-4